MFVAFKSRLYKATFLSLLILCIGVGGYVFIFNYSLVDALYMTLITVTTVGFGEVHPFGTGEKIFTIGLILTSLLIFGYVASSFSEYLISGKFFYKLKTKKVQKKIKKLQGHTIVCGFGRNGKQALLKLNSYKQEVVVVENNKELIQKLDTDKVLNVEGNATLDQTLLKAGILNAQNLITVLPSDADNLFVVLSARQLNRKCKIISRASKESSHKKLKIAGANHVIMPDKLGGAHMALLVVSPDVIEFVDCLTIKGYAKANLEDIAVNDLPSEYLGKTILDLDLRRKTGCTVIGYKSLKHDYIINPDVTIKLTPNSNLIVLGSTEQINALRKLF
ncbi:MAG: potassium channel family protein [Tenacibaculum sp.]